MPPVKPSAHDGRPDRPLRPTASADPDRPGRAVDHSGATNDRGGPLGFVPARRGHFQLESGHHGGLWLDLDALFAEPRRLEPLVAALADRLARHDVEVVCGPLVGGAFLAQALAHRMRIGFAFTERSDDLADGALFRARYRLPRAFAQRVAGRRVALVDDVISQGSAVRASLDALASIGVVPVVVGAVLALGARRNAFLADRRLPVETLEREDLVTWAPTDCPSCAAGIALEDPDP